jgi:hypothetical protein
MVQEVAMLYMLIVPSPSKTMEQLRVVVAVVVAVVHAQRLYLQQNQQVLTEERLVAVAAEVEVPLAAKVQEEHWVLLLYFQDH